MKEGNMKKVEVVAAVIIKNKQVLCTQRNFNKLDYISYKFEFPGGKIEEGESSTEALTREIYEEMNAKINISDKNFFMTVDHKYPDFNLIMHTFLCIVDDLTFNLNEHISHKWCDRSCIEDLDWAAADIPIVKKLLSEDIL